MKRLLYKAKRVLGLAGPAKKTYSQCGEDVIVDFIFRKIGIPKPTYIDIGAHDPEWISNTAFFYRKGCRGINIEPNPDLFKRFLRHRRGDINLNIGVSQKNGELEFYSMDNTALSTLSKEGADELVKKGSAKIVKVSTVPTMTIGSVITQHAKGVFPDFLSLDVEGLDKEILGSIEYTSSFPKVICVETISYSTTGHGEKDTDLITFLSSKGYMVFADTYINTIFVKRDLWER